MAIVAGPGVVLCVCTYEIYAVPQCRHVGLVGLVGLLGLVGLVGLVGPVLAVRNGWGMVPRFRWLSLSILRVLAGGVSSMVSSLSLVSLSSLSLLSLLSHTFKLTF